MERRLREQISRSLAADCVEEVGAGSAIDEGRVIGERALAPHAGWGGAPIGISFAIIAALERRRRQHGSDAGKGMV